MYNIVLNVKLSVCEWVGQKRKMHGDLLMNLCIVFVYFFSYLKLLPENINTSNLYISTLDNWKLEHTVYVYIMDVKISQSFM